MIAALVAVMIAAAGVTAIVLTVGGDDPSGPTGAQGNASTATAGSAAQRPSGGSSSSQRPLPPSTPTGKPYNDDDPQIGHCADIARRPNGVVIYRADCGDPAATLILEVIQPEKCPAKGFYPLKSQTNETLCFTHNFKPGDCVNMEIPRRTSCDDTASPAGDKLKVTVAEVRLAQQDGTGCSNPALFLQVGKDGERGVACMTPSAPRNDTAEPSR